MHRKVGSALVVGAGIGGIRTALDLAESGYGVTLVERTPHVGGVLGQLDYQFPSNHCGMCKMLPLVERDAGAQYCLRRGVYHANIDLLLSTEVMDIQGQAGAFTATLRQKQPWVDPKRCISCGACSEVCPVTVADSFNQGLTQRKAIYRPVPQAIDSAFVIDHGNCTRCKACEAVCPTDAIHVADRARRQFRILVVDDELIVRDSLKETLYEQGYSMAMAASGPEALAELAANAYDLMLLDIKMPGMGGVEVLEKAKEAFPELTVVMMTAYATVETAVEAMKTGARDYLIKPFEPDMLLPMVADVYEAAAVAGGPTIEVGAVVLSNGSAYFDPREGKNPYGYGILPNVVTSLEFERYMSGSGPLPGGPLKRLTDGKPIRKIAWIQCVGSRDLQHKADFCSNICCMFAIKEAMLAQSKADGTLQTTIYYMDMRTFGKSFQRYRDQAEHDSGVKFVRGRVHSLIPTRTGGDLIVGATDLSGEQQTETFDLVVLSVGQRPSAGTEALAQMLDLELNQWGFIRPQPFSLARSSQEGILLSGSSGGLKDISESVMQASAAALNASRVIHRNGGSLAPAESADSAPKAPDRRSLQEQPRILVLLCGCNGTLKSALDGPGLEQALLPDPAVVGVQWFDRGCDPEAAASLTRKVANYKANRVLIGACRPLNSDDHRRNLAQAVGLDPHLLEIVDIRREVPAETSPTDATQAVNSDHMRRATAAVHSRLAAATARLKRVDPTPAAGVAVQQRALVVGAGIAGMTAALAIADHGFGVDLVEQGSKLGGNLNWLTHTLEGHATADLLTDTRQQIEKQPLIQVHTDARVLATTGEVGRFQTLVQVPAADSDPEGAPERVETVQHGVTVLATGGEAATTRAYGYGDDERVLTQKELAQRLGAETDRLDAAKLKTVVMIQCVDSREEPRNYCSRVCCANALKNAFLLKERNPALKIYVLYRDIMSYGFSECFYTKARREGVLFIQYTLDRRPKVTGDGAGLAVTLTDPIINRELEIETDLVVLATGIVPTMPVDLAQQFGIERNEDGFFKAADEKWRPVDALRAGVFGCGLALAPYNLEEAVTSAEAASRRALSLLARQTLAVDRVVAGVHSALCSLCQRCIAACPYEARSIDTESDCIRVNPLMCQGCGACATACPNGAAYVEGFQMQLMLEEVDAALSGI